MLEPRRVTTAVIMGGGGDVFLQDLWFHQAEGVVIEKAVADGELVFVRARASAEQAAYHACGTTWGRVRSRYLPDHTTATVSAWLANHPGVEVICRDRSTEAGRLGASDAVHVADRWHIWSRGSCEPCPR
ncbi:hypothetical protein [Streptomyces werraensis]|uniref:hypothetical protein n=1 Tax=Streptomyces werraensis TaxID=68284 RepID=UPI00380F89E4